MEVGQWRPVELPYVTYGRNGPLLCEGRDLYGNGITSPSHFLRRHPASPHVFLSSPIVDLSLPICRKEPIHPPHTRLDR